MTNKQLQLVTKWSTSSITLGNQIWHPAGKLMISDCYISTPKTLWKKDYSNATPIEIEGCPVEFYVAYKNSPYKTVEEFMHAKRGLLAGRKFGF